MKAIEIQSLTKDYGGGAKAVDDISFSVEEGEVFGLLGPNGAGKTTTIKMITTLAKPTSGSIKVLGMDAVRSPREVRKRLAYVPQAISVDGDLSGYENLLIFSKLFHVDKRDRSARIDEALEYMNLAARANDLAKHYSGGMMRRLEIAQTLVNRPRVLFLDEPTIGLDPTSKAQVWEYVRRLSEEFRTAILITTHDMEEANQLCQRVAIMNAGKIAVIGSPEELKRTVGVDLVVVKIRQGRIPLSLPSELGRAVSLENGLLEIQTRNGESEIAPIVDYLESNGVVIESISLTRPTLGDVFLKYGGRNLESGTMQEVRSLRRSFGK
ncbi:MAG TPA: ATP-binding cassette domain-containing protein [Nitrososphaerales archaeon]|nr:ATP-binding cassette domain-containing protein [Nitrososphaerales archaeon]